MNNLDIAGLLSTYALKVSNAKTTKQLRRILMDLRSEIDLRKVRMEVQNENRKSSGNPG